MAGGRTHTDVLAIFETRFDYLSARNVLADALKVAGVEQKDSYEVADLEALLGALSGLATATEGLAERLLAADEAPAEEAPAEEAPAEEAPAKEEKAAKEAKPAKGKKAAAKKGKKK